MSMVDELVTLLGFDIDPNAATTAQKYEKAIDQIQDVAKKTSVALLGAATFIKGFALAQAHSIADAGKFADQINVSFEKLQEMEYAAEKAGGSVSELRSDLQKFSKLRPGDPVETLLRAADRLQGMSRRGQQQFADAVGISPGTLKLIQQGRSGIEQLTKRSRELGIILDENARVNAEKATAAFLDVKNVVMATGRSIIADLLPSITKTIDKTTDWIRENRSLISSGVRQFVDGVSNGFEKFAKFVEDGKKKIEEFIGPFDKLTKDLDASQPIMIGTAIALGALALAFIAANIPLILMATAISALILVIDDLYSFFQGGDSIVGEWVKSFTDAYPNLSELVKNIAGLFADLAVFIAGGLLRAASNLLKAFGIILSGIDSIIGGVLQAIEDVLSGKNPFDRLVKWFSEIGDRLKQMALNLGSSILSSITGGLGSLGESLVNALGGGLSMSATVGGAANVPAGAIAGGGTVNNTINQNISGAGDPRAVGQEAANRSGMGVSLQQSRPGMSGPTVG